MTPEKRADIAEKYAWKPGEREEMQRDMVARAERERQQRSAENLEWAKERAAARAEAERQPAVKAEAKMSGVNMQVWETRVKDQIRARSERDGRIMEGVIVDVVGPMKKTAEKANGEIVTLREEVTKLQIELAELRGELKTRSAMADMEARMARLEAPSSPARLKTIAG